MTSSKELHLPSEGAQLTQSTNQNAELNKIMQLLSSAGNKHGYRCGGQARADMQPARAKRGKKGILGKTGKARVSQIAIGY